MSPVLLLFDHFWGHPVNSAFERISITFDLTHFLGGSQVSELTNTFSVDKHIGSFEVSVDDFVEVQITEAFEDLPGVLADDFF